MKRYAEIQSHAVLSKAKICNPDLETEHEPGLLSGSYGEVSVKHNSRRTAYCLLILFPILFLLFLPGCEELRDPDLILIQNLLPRLTEGNILTQTTTIRFGTTGDQSYLGAGWSNPEPGFTWMADQKASIRAEIYDTQNVIMSVQAWPLSSQTKGPQGFTVAVNEKEVCHQIMVDKTQEYKIALPAEALIQGKNQITFSSDWIARPMDVEPGSTDSRTLSIAFNSVSFSNETKASETARIPVQGQAIKIRDIQEVLSISRPMRIRLPILIPEKACLEIDFGVDSSKPRSVEVDLRVALKWPQKEVVCLQEWFGAQGSIKLGRRLQRRLDLSAYTGMADLLIEIGITGPLLVEIPRCSLNSLQLYGTGNTSAVTKNLMLITVDTLRSDTLGLMGHPLIRTPHCDRFSKQSLVFSQAYCHAPLTGPSHVSIFTGCYPFEHRVKSNCQVMPENNVTMAEIMAAAGRKTAAFVGAGIMESRYGVLQGFQDRFDKFDLSWHKRASQITEETIQWLGAVQPPFFSWLHYYDPHAPYAPPRVKGDELIVHFRGQDLALLPLSENKVHVVHLDLEPGLNKLIFSSSSGQQLNFMGITPIFEGCQVVERQGWHKGSNTLWGGYQWIVGSASITVSNPHDSSVKAVMKIVGYDDPGEQQLWQRYLGEVEYVDQEIGVVFTTLKKMDYWDNSLLILTSDHGESFGEHGLFGHIQKVSESLMTVPLVVKEPSLAASISALHVRQIDILPTVLELLDLSISPSEKKSFTGQSFLKWTDEPPGNRVNFGETHRPDAKKASLFIKRKWLKFILSEDGEVEMYDLKNDPRELHPGKPEAETATLFKELLAGFTEALAGFTGDGAKTEHDQETKEKLRMLGYLE
ncbi:sulfatase [candidate division CSSED10-310 bacterium]|uniref:Sulfatase n=1 Tax=candidate division CSSED10-310 bacterium TaxID=2855610 RepID=A0ABV6YYH8_UNCC1